MSLHLITGYAGIEHITSADQGAYNMATFYEGEFVFERGNQFEQLVVSNNAISIADGEAMMQGRYIKLPVGTSETLTIDNGSQGMKRKDIVVIRYTKDVDTGVETAALAVVKGTPDSSSPADPALTTGNITDGSDLVNEMPLYRVNINGLNIDSVDTLFITRKQSIGLIYDKLFDISVNVNVGMGGTTRYLTDLPTVSEIKSRYSFLIHSFGYSTSSSSTLSVPDRISNTNIIPTEMIKDGVLFSDIRIYIPGTYSSVIEFNKTAYGELKTGSGSYHNVLVLSTGGSSYGSSSTTYFNCRNMLYGIV